MTMAKKSASKNTLTDHECWIDDLLDADNAPNGFAETKCTIKEISIAFAEIPFGEKNRPLLKTIIDRLKGSLNKWKNTYPALKNDEILLKLETAIKLLPPTPVTTPSTSEEKKSLSSYSSPQFRRG